MRNQKIEKEYNKIKDILSKNLDSLDLIDGLILETARTKINLDELDLLAQKCPLIDINPNNPTKQKPTVLANELVKYRSSYTHLIKTLMGLTPSNENGDLLEFKKEMEEFFN